MDTQLGLTLNVAAAVVERWQDAGTRIAIRSADTGATISACELVDTIKAIAGALRAEGIKPGARIGLVCGNDLAFVTTYYGILYAGAVAVPLSLRLPPAMYARALYEAAVQGVILIGRPALDDLGPLMESILEISPGFLWVDADAPVPAREGTRLLAEVLANSDRTALPSMLQKDSEAIILGTSGTTGPGKGVRLSHGNLLASAGGFGRRVQFSRSTNALIAFPVASSFGQIALLSGSLLHGGMATLHEPYKPSLVLESLLSGVVTHFVGVPTMYAALAQRMRQPGVLNDASRALLETLFYGVGGATVPTSLIEMFDEEFGMTLRQGYGLTETAAVASFKGHGPAGNPESAGAPLDTCRVEIVDESGNLVEPGESGEIVICGANIMLGYLDQPALKEPRLRTGDLGYVDEQGHIVVVDRLKDLIIRGGENIYPRLVESLIMRLPGVTHAAVVGKHDDYYGEVPVAFVVRTNDSVTESAILASLTSQLPATNIPVACYFVQEVPLGPTGKILKRELRQRLLAHESPV